MKILTLILLCVFLVFGCDTLTDMLGMDETEPLDNPTGFTATAGHEEIILSWTAVPEADTYILYYTSDGTKPTITSDSITDIVTTGYTHTDLDASKTYIYGLIAKNDDSKSDLVISTQIQPELIWRFDVTFSTTAYASGKAVIRIWEDDVNLFGRVNDAAARYTKTNVIENGKIAAEFDVLRNKYYAYSVFFDKDANGELSTNDEVWGSDGGTGLYTVYSITDAFTASKSLTISNWEMYDNVGHSTYTEQ